MSRKVTKEMAKEAATRMACEYYDSTIKKQEEIISAYAQELVKKYIPYPVRAVLKEYPKYFDTTKAVAVTTHYDVAGRQVTGKILYAQVSEIPYQGRIIEVELSEYNKLKLLRLRLDGLKEDKDKLITNISATIYGLRTDVKVMKELPEALEYISFPPIKALPVDYKSLEEIRNMIKGLKREKK